MEKQSGEAREDKHGQSQFVRIQPSGWSITN